ncbi:hypothetical protein VNO80_19416 [Phaseolus coccineus]|uniref:Uncharacterized protein n=1 Tax=Phaseolus coccineus TaxID=3886 RepID=A0AAN9QXB2_PHACN
MSLGKTFEKEELNIKILKYLDRYWQPKVTTISECKDLTSLTTTSLFGKLREYELEMNRMNVQENEDKHVRNIVLKAVGHKNCQDSSDDSDGDTLNLLFKKFTKFLKKNSNKNHSSNSQLLDAFKETHEEANRLALLNNRLKGLNNWMENRVKALEGELENSKNDFENLELIYKNSSCICDSSFCENSESLEKKVHYLVKTMDKLSKGISKFETVLASQKCVFGNSGLGFNPQSKKSGVSKPFSTIREKQSIEKSKQPVVSRFYCMKMGHSLLDSADKDGNQVGSSSEAHVEDEGEEQANTTTVGDDTGVADAYDVGAYDADPSDGNMGERITSMSPFERFMMLSNSNRITQANQGFVFIK